MRLVGLVIIGLTAALLAGATTFEASSDTRYVAQLRQAAAQVDASSREVAALQKGDRASFASVGKRLSASAAAACRMLRTYRDARYRYGTDEELRLVVRMLEQLADAANRFEATTEARVPSPTAKQRSVAEQELRDYARKAARKQINRWIRDERLADILTIGDIKQVRKRLEDEIVRRLDAEVKRLSTRALGVALSLDVDIRTQARRTAEQAALNWLARTVFKANPNGAFVQLVGKEVIRFLRTQLKQALRDHRNVTKRTNRTVKGFKNREAELQQLIDRPDGTRLAAVRRALARAQRAVDATGYLKSDLRKQSRDSLLVQLKRQELLLKAKIRAARKTFLLDSKLAKADLRKLADEVCALRGDIDRLNKRLAKSGKPSAGACAVSLRTDKGKPGVSGNMTLVLKPNPDLEGKPLRGFATISITGAEGPRRDVPRIEKIWLYKKLGDPLILGQGDPRSLDFNTDAKAGRSTPQRVEGMFLNVSDRAVLEANPFLVRLFVTAFDDKGGVWTELEGLCRAG